MPSPKTLRVLLVRHGQTPTTGKLLPGRAPGLHLSDAGRAQAETVAERLEPVGLAAVYTSPLERARETAEPTERRTGLPAVVEPALLECDFGDWTGQELTALSRLKQWRTVQTAPSTFRFPGGESFVELQVRMIALMERLRREHAGHTVACFSHADPIKALLTHAVGTHLDHFQRIDVATGSISAIDWPARGAPVVRTVNSVQGPPA
ncbi:histidine phosphatase family protein [Micropruina sonneratiae]|uniref:histidine phosphatase family protein n=1 Tax=Micropruina sonneratiae TaxID=2986940 RepID=UPI0022280623|nr:histidine phosphatase family protein [Micropruina sp. KQZ13P-5]MCW3158836.1 histidine phosphatase family protein [Micropruina sp. KQZ13P-5]